MTHPTTKKSTSTADTTVAAARHKEWLNLQSATRSGSQNLIIKVSEAVVGRLAGKGDIEQGSLPAVALNLLKVQEYCNRHI